ncbi:MAG TPA: cation diffusion facilitator family transporter [Ignavibacteriaceae bacterium]|nr:cation diffusion facilitator family transporter [Ignavibacteriaceae bacterium]
MKNDQYKLKKFAATLSLAVGIGMFIFKFSAYLITGSAAIFSDAAESIVHVLATSMALYSIIISSKPPDKSHLYGHGNVEYFSAGIEGALIVIAAFVIIYEAGSDIIKGPELQRLGTGMLIITAAGIVNLFLGLYLVKTGKKTNSLTLVADGKHVLTDAYTSIGVVIGIILVMITGIVYFDPIFAIAVALNILFTGYNLVRESIGGLMNETNPEILNKISNKLIMIRRPYYIDIHELRFWKSSEDIFIDFHLTLPYYMDIRQSHSEEDYITEELTKELPNSQLKIHLDFCVPQLCRHCEYSECEVREYDKTESVNWTVNKLTGKPLLNLPH